MDPDPVGDLPGRGSAISEESNEGEADRICDRVDALHLIT
jgi:hypothetical protein